MITHTSKCEDCASDNATSRLVPIGEEVHIRARGKEGDTHYTFLQCPACGSLWQMIKDQGGLGGNGRFFSRLTKSF